MPVRDGSYIYIYIYISLSLSHIVFCFAQVMFEDTSEWTALSCGHKFANSTWESYIETAITAGSKETGEATGLTCITGGCRVPVPESMILRFAGAHTAKYKRFVGDMYAKKGLCVHFF